MQTNVIIVVLACVIFQCNGHLPSITGILTGAHKHVHDTVHGVANTVLGGFNFDGQVGIHSRPQPPRTEQPETVIVIVDKTPDNNYGPGFQNRPNQGYVQYNDYNNRPHRPYGQNNYGHGRPWQNQNGNYNNANPNGPYEHHHNNHGQNPNNYGNHNSDGYNQNGNQHQHANQNDYNRPEQTTQGYGNPNNGYNNRPSDQSPQNNEHTNQNNYGQTQSTSTAETRPTFGSIHENDDHTQKPYQNSKTTESDVPQFVPLNPNEYVYGGEKINVTAPKRETDNNKPVSDNDDEDFPIDIRFQDN